jgi:predicted metalloendopeptidase
MRWLACLPALVLLAAAQQPATLFHDACTDTAAVADLGIQPVATYLQQVTALQNSRQLAGAVATLHRYQLTAVFPVATDPDGPSSSELRTGAVHTATQKLFALLGDPPLEAQKETNDALNLAVALALPPSPRQTFSLDELRQRVPGFDWITYFQVIDGPTPPSLVTSPAALGALRGQLIIAPLESWKSYLRWRWLQQTAAWLSPPFVAWHFSTLGQPQTPSRERFCRQLTAAFPGDAYDAVPITRDDFFGDVLRLRAWRVRHAVLKSSSVAGGR